MRYNIMEKIHIDSLTYYFDNNFFIEDETIKKKIIISNTTLIDMDHISRYKFNSNKKNIPHFTIDTLGNIFQHFDTKYYSKYLNESKINKESITICFSNLGWLKYKVSDDNYFNWCNIEVNDSNKIFEKEYRSYRYWNTITDEQHKSIVKLCKYLLNKHNTIEKNSINHLFDEENWIDFSGILYHSNITHDNMSPGPSFNTKLITKLAK